jgi:large subunit ribosomal protein L1
MAHIAKKYKAAATKVDRNKRYKLDDALKLVKETATKKFDETVDAAINLGVDPKHADQVVRGAVVLPHGMGKAVRLAVFAKGDKAKEATEAGADIVGAEDLAGLVEGGMLDFDAAIATPDMMGVVGKLGRVLGPRGLMPNPKAGTVTFDVAKAVQDMKAGKVEYRTDKFGVIHLIVGKKSFDAEKLVANYSEVLGEIVRAKPAAAKGKYLRTITMTTTMGPGVPLDTSKVRALLEEEA